MAHVLGHSYGFAEIEELYDEEVTRGGIARQLRRYRQELGPDDALLIFFAGHGDYDAQTEEGYWIPSEARKRIGDDAAIEDYFPISQVKQFAETASMRHLLVVSDACFAGTLLRGGDSRKRAPDSDYSTFLRNRCRRGLTSAELLPVPDESEFARQILQTLENPPKETFTDRDIEHWIAERVHRQTKRHVLNAPLQLASGNELGRFVFRFKKTHQIEPKTSYQEKTPIRPRPPIRFGRRITVRGPSDACVVMKGRPLQMIPPSGRVSFLVDAGTYEVCLCHMGRRLGERVVVKGDREYMVDFDHECLVPGITFCLDDSGHEQLPLIRVQPGGFQMGSTDPRYVNEHPRHLVQLTKPFWVGMTEVTRNQFSAVMGRRPNGVASGSRAAGEFPVGSVSWHDAVAFCQRFEADFLKQNFGQRFRIRLPTEAEWEFACRSGWRQYAEENLAARMSAICQSDTSGGRPWQVGRSQPSPLGLFEMQGNLWEWCQDWFDERYYENSPSTNPTGPKHGRARVVRGGAYNSDSVNCRSTRRDCRPPIARRLDTGFRIVLSSK